MYEDTYEARASGCVVGGGADEDETCGRGRWECDQEEVKGM